MKYQNNATALAFNQLKTAVTTGNHLNQQLKNHISNLESQGPIKN